MPGLNRPASKRNKPTNISKKKKRSSSRGKKKMGY